MLNMDDNENGFKTDGFVRAARFFAGFFFGRCFARLQRCFVRLKRQTS